jgi:hypothetical protein
MQITGQPCRCRLANNQAAVQPDSKPIRSTASPVAAIKRAIISEIGWQLGLAHNLAFAVQNAERALFPRNIDADVVHGGSSG